MKTEKENLTNKILELSIQNKNFREDSKKNAASAEN
jgi:hypothetical protein